MENSQNTEHKHEVTSSTHAAPAGFGATPAWLLPASILAAAVMVSGSLVYMTYSSRSGSGDIYGGEQGQPSVTVEAPAAADRDVILGDPDAPVSIVLYEDFQCPYCVQFFDETESAIRTAYVETGKAKIVYRHFPLVQIHPEALPAAEASECAKDQGKFWEYHDELYRSESSAIAETTLNRALYDSIATKLGLNMGEFKSCVDSGKHRAFVQAQGDEAATKYGVRSTPTIFVNDQKVEGAYPFSTFQTLIDAEL